MPKISVIIPVYNVEKYLEECLNSVVNQTLKDIEIICVNDGSTDNSLQILKDFSTKDNRIKIINTENQGVGVARNNGIKIANGEYIFFLDSDDYILPNTLLTMLKKSIETHSDIVMIGTEAFAEDNSKKTLKRTKDMNNWLENRNDSHYKVTIENYEDSLFDINCVSWGKLFTKEFIIKNNLRFINKKAVHEDNGFWIKVCSCLPEISFIEDIGLMYRIRTGSITTDIDKKRYKKFKMLNLKWNIDDALDYIKKYQNQYYNFFKTQIIQSNQYKELFEINIYNMFRFRWNPNDKLISFFGLHIFREKPKDKKYKVIKSCGIKIYKTKIRKKNFYPTLNYEYLKSLANIQVDTKISTSNIDTNIINSLKNFDNFYYYPNSGNGGDVVISCSVFQLLKKYNYKVYDESKFSYDKSYNLVYGGGGIWIKNYKKDYQEILPVFKSPFLKRCVILPSSFRDCSDLMSILDERFTVFCREKESYDYCIKNNNKATFVLSDDIVINANFDIFTKKYFNTNNFQKFFSNQKYIKQVVNEIYPYYVEKKQMVLSNLRKFDDFRIGYMFREDSEKAININVANSFDVSNILYSKCRDEGLCYCIGKLFLYAIDQFDIIVTDRLHIGICAAKLGKKVILLDNTYGKIRSVYEYSLKNYNNVLFSNEKNLNNSIENLKNQINEEQNKIILLPENLEEFLLEYGSFNNYYLYERI